MTTSPRISVIIPTLQEERLLPLLLADLHAQTLRPDEILVVDGGSTDRTCELAAPCATVIKAGRGVGLQRGLGVERATGDILICFDADVRLEPQTIERLVHAFLRKRCDVACPLYWPIQATLFVRTTFLFFNSLFWLFQFIAPSGAGCCIVITRAHALRAGNFRTDTLYDDIALVRKAGRMGRFRMLPVWVGVSDRRFRKEGSVQVFARWLLLSPFFLLGIFRIQKIIPYTFAHYDDPPTTKNARHDVK